MIRREVFAQSVHSDDEVTRVAVRFDEPTRVDHASVFDEPTRVDHAAVFDEPTRVDHAAVLDEPTRVDHAAVFNEPTRVTHRPRPKSHVRMASFVLLPVALALAGVTYARPAIVRAHASPARVEARVPGAAASPKPNASPRAPRAPAPSSPVISAPRPIAAVPSHRDGPPPDERAAVEAVASGAYDRAARLYDALSASHPDREAYREAARISKAAASATEGRP